MIYTVTFNPSLDYTIHVENFELGKVNRTVQEDIYAGGKGINVSMVLKNLGYETTAFGFLSGFTGQEIERLLKEKGISTEFIHIENGTSRINLKIRSDVESEINGMGPVIRKEDLELLYEQLDTLKDDDVLVLAGSIPSGMPQSIYRDIMSRLQSKRIKIAVDATKDLLMNVLAYHPFVIKPNNHELSEIFDIMIDSKEKAVVYAKELQKKGAQNGAYIQAPSAETFRACQQASGGLIKLVTLAPEMEGSVEFIKELKDEVHISVGHTTADYDTAKAAFEAGADHVTHLYNAMPPLNHRAPGVIGAAADNDHVYAELISDGLHIHGSAIRAAFRMFGPERIVLISDSMMACGMENGEYELGGQKVFMKDRKATLADGTIAGSATCLYDCMKIAMSFDIPEADAIFAATRNPAKSIGVYDRVGSISVGKEADMLLVDDEYHLKQVF